jgi:hypothetical protein
MSDAGDGAAYKEEEWFNFIRSAASTRTFALTG